MRLAASPLARLLGLITAAALALAGLVLTTSPVARAADPLAGAPAVGSCHDATFAQAEGASLTQPVVACAADHTLLTTGLVQLPPDVDLADFDQVQAAAGCPRKSQQLLGKNPLRRALTLYYTFIFVPTAAQQDAGARWASCHLAAWDTQGLNDLPTKVTKLRKKPAAAVARCLSRSNSYVTCAEKHAFRATVAVFVKAKGKDKAVERTMNVQGPKICSRKAGRTGRYTYDRYTPTKVVLTCFKKTKK